MGCRKLTYRGKAGRQVFRAFGQERALESKAVFFRGALEKKGHSDFFRLNAYTYGFNGKERDTNLGGGTHYDYGFRIYKPKYARFLSTDPLTKSYPMLTPYQFASNRPIDGIDLDGLEYLNSTSVYSEGIGVAAGITYGFNIATSKGTAADMIGITKFRTYSLIGPANQDLEEGNRKAKTIYIGEASADIGVKLAYDKPTFVQAAKAFNLSFSTASAKVGIGGSLQFGEDVYGIRVGIGIGASFKSGNQETIFWSVSLTQDEATKAGYFGKDWFVGDVEDIKVGKVTTFTGQVYSNGKATGVIVESGANEIKTQQDDGTTKTTYKPKGLWKSSGYSEAEKEYDK